MKVFGKPSYRLVLTKTCAWAGSSLTWSRLRGPRYSGLGVGVGVDVPGQGLHPFALAAARRPGSHHDEPHVLQIREGGCQVHEFLRMLPRFEAGDPRHR